MSTSTLYNPESKTDGAYSEVYNNNLPKAGQIMLIGVIGIDGIIGNF